MGYMRGFMTAYFQQSWPLYLIVIVFFGTGILMGSLGANTLPPEQIKDLQSYLQSFFAQAAEIEVDRSKMFKGILSDNLLIGLVIYILGLTIICLPLVLALIFFRGFVLGFTIGFLTANSDWREFMIVFISMLPQNLLFIPALIIGGAAALSFSMRLVRRLFNSQTQIAPQFAGYTLIMSGCVLAFALAALAEGYITPELTRLLASLLANG
ncbi:Stage II sporulation protein M [Sporotomaculum syntrophicum]|uniref:Stage II sporulation protein M n=1 Tax=Sporotomaculum syntrophicum TaxID=182264 RepID=A0A9D2WSX2_9FIRM|nr:stage II sporulation protein M [Sporotomaculum syntrophicum]KAF1086508.1 Stage II sporulation protein M [Sporotomaculum syntrophicum]